MNSFMKVSFAVILLGSFLCGQAVFAQDEAAPAADAQDQGAQEEAEPQREFTKKEIIERLHFLVTNRGDIQKAFPEVKAEGEGKEATLLVSEIPAEKYDKDVLMKLLAAVNQHITTRNLQNLERTQKQMKTLKQIEQMNRLQKNLRSTNQPTVPKIPKPPKRYLPTKKNY